MRKIIGTVVLFFLFTIPLSAQDKLKIVTPHETIASIAEEIGGSQVEVEALVSGTRDPHMVPAKPSFMTKTRRADLWIRFGMDLEIGYERLILEGSRNSDIQIGNKGHLDLSQNIVKLEVPHGTINRSMGDIHPMGNPHYWLDPFNGRIIARSIADRLAELQPANMEYFINRGEMFVENLDRTMFGEKALAEFSGDELWQHLEAGTIEKRADEKGIELSGWYAAMKPLEGKSFVSYHKTFTYFAHRFGLKIPIELEPKPGIPPGPRHVLKVITTIKELDIRLIVTANYYNKASAENASSKTSAEVVTLPTAVGGSGDATDYLSLIQLLVDTFSSKL
jgi:zinc/manganese transport system substrate-binding protein